MPQSPKLVWYHGWSQKVFFENQAPLVLPRPHSVMSGDGLVSRLDWLLAGRLSKLLANGAANVNTHWEMNVLFVGERAISILWYEPSGDSLEILSRASKVLKDSGSDAMCFVTTTPLSHLRAQEEQVKSHLLSHQIKSLSIWAS